MPLRERSRAALRALPRWVTALGIAALAGELTLAALLAAGPHRPPHARVAAPTAPPTQGATPAVPATHGATPTVPAAPGVTETVQLHVDGVPLQVACTPVPPDPCGPQVGYGATSTEFGQTPTARAARLPLTKTIQVKAGDFVTLNAWSMTDSPLTCSITAGGRLLSAITAGTPNAGQTSDADCRTMIPASGTSPGAARRTAVLQVSAIPDATCSQAPRGCWPGVVSYTTPTGGASDFNAAAPLKAEVPVPAGGTVSLDVAGTAEELATCSITVNGDVLSRDTTHGSAGQADCKATIP